MVLVYYPWTSVLSRGFGGRKQTMLCLHPPYTAESFPTPASPGRRCPWELAPMWESRPRYRSMGIRESLPERRWSSRPIPSETSSFSTALLYTGHGEKGDRSVFLFSQSSRSLLSDANSQFVSVSWRKKNVAPAAAGRRRRPTRFLFLRAI